MGMYLDKIRGRLEAMKAEQRRERKAKKARKNPTQFPFTQAGNVERVTRVIRAETRNEITLGGAVRNEITVGGAPRA